MQASTHGLVRAEVLPWKVLNFWTRVGSLSISAIEHVSSRRNHKSRVKRTFCNKVPPRRVQRVVLAPRNIRAICLARTVLVRIRRTHCCLAVQRRVRADVAVPPVQNRSALLILLFPSGNIRVRVEDIKGLDVQDGE